MNDLSVGMRESAGMLDMEWEGLCNAERIPSIFLVNSFFRGLLIWLDGNVHVECSLRFLHYF